MQIGHYCTFGIAILCVLVAVFMLYKGRKSNCDQHDHAIEHQSYRDYIAFMLSQQYVIYCDNNDIAMRWTADQIFEHSHCYFLPCGVKVKTILGEKIVICTPEGILTYLASELLDKSL